MNPSVEKVISALKKNNVEVEYFKTGDEAREAVLRRIPDGAAVGLGGSTTLSQIGLIDALRRANISLIDQYEKGISSEEGLERRRKGLLADIFITGTNALTERGQLVNIDGMGNRVAAQIFGPRHVFIVTSVSKIVRDVDAALERIRKVAAPLNAQRLGVDSACARGHGCELCDPQTSLCNFISIIERQRVKGRMTVFLIEEQFGY
jgi:L-lactate utilization protein LutB